MLILAVHTMKEVTAKVPFAIILLQDFVSSKKLPENLKCRQLVPSSGSVSTSLWDVTDSDELLAWLTENITVDCTHAVFEVQEDFAIGLGEITRTRAAERAAKAVGSAASATAHQVSEFDQRLKISERANHAVEVVKDSAVMQQTAAAFSRAGSSVKTATNKVLEQPAVQTATDAVGNGFKKLSHSLSGFTNTIAAKVKRSSSRDQFPEVTTTEVMPGSLETEYQPPVVPVPEPQPASAAETATPAFTIEDESNASPTASK